MSTAASISSRGDDVWLLASAIVYEAREVATEFNDYLAPFYELAKAATFVWVMATSVFPGLRRIASMQEKLIARLQSSTKENWPREQCRALAELLRSLIMDERTFIDNGLAHLRPGQSLLTRYVTVLRGQLDVLGDLCLLLEALAVPEEPKPGDADCQGFLSLLAGPAEYDFCETPEQRRVPAHA